jgi:hypothetical protein
MFDFSPNIIGATGGSGTRVFARIVRRGGMFIGENLNASEDAIDFGSYSDRWINTYMSFRRSVLPSNVDEPMRRELNQMVARHCESLTNSSRRWGWKEPRSIYLLPFIHEQFPDLKFLHVIRDGRDMAYSSNQNQLQKHGQTLLRWHDRWRSLPEQSLILWTRINELAAGYGEKHLGSHYLRIRFEDLCFDPYLTIQQIFEFFDLSGNIQKIAAEEIIPPKSLGRWRAQQNGWRLSRLAKNTLDRFGYATDNVAVWTKAAGVGDLADLYIAGLAKAERAIRPSKQ